MAALLCVALIVPAGSPVWAAPPSDDVIADESTAPVADPPRDGEPKTALEWYDRGIELGGAGEYLGAAEAFLKSFEIQPTAAALLNAAYAYESAGRPLEAVLTYQRYLERADADDEHSELARAAIEALMPELAVLKGLRFDTKDPPAHIRVAGRERTLDEFPLAMLPGEIEIEVEASDGRKGSERYTLAAGESLVVDVRALLPSPIVEPPRPELEDPDRAQREAAQRDIATHGRRLRVLRPATWAGLGVTGAAGVTILTVGLLAVRGKRLYEAEDCFGPPHDGVCPPDYDGDPEARLAEFERLRLGTNIAIGIGAGLALTTLVVGLVALRERNRHRAARARLEALRPTARIRFNPGGLRLEF